LFEQTTHIYLNPVQAEHADAFERFLAEVVVPTVAKHRPDLVGRWRVLRATAAEPADDAVITYAFVFDGGELADWDLNTLIPAEYGEQEAQRRLAEWASTFVPYQQWVAALGDHPDEPTQVGWTFEPAMSVEAAGG
jgi:hypothetical protein